MKNFCTATGQPAGAPAPAAFITRLLLALLLALPGLARAQTTSFACTGGTQSYAVPAGATRLTVVATGAYNGAVVQATVTVTPGESLRVEVGGTGSPNGPSGGGNMIPFGYNGGGGSGSSGRGGGATDLRRTGTSTGDYLTSRNALLVAGGGGAEGYNLQSDSYYAGGSGGTPPGGNGTAAVGGYAGAGATATAAGAGATGASAGAANVGGANAGFGGSGGGGYYGGGGGGQSGSGSNVSGGGGGGGSSWVMAGSTAISYSPSGVLSNGAMTITAIAPSPTATPTVAAPANGGTVTTATPTYSGTAAAGSTVRLYVDGTLLGTTTTATAGGTYSLAQPTALTQGSHSVAATAQASGQPVSASSATSTFTVVLAPVISSFTPLSGPVGTSVTITGTNLSGATSVRFNGTAQTSFTGSATQIVLAVPAGATTGTLTVTTPNGTSAASSQPFTLCAAPVATARNVSLTLDAGGNAPLAATAVNNGSTADCGPAPAGALSVSASAFSCANVVPATVASGLSFNGSSQYLAVAAGNSLPIGNGSYTLEAWIKPTAMGAYGIIGWGNYGTGPQVNALRLFNDGRGIGLENYWWGPDLVTNTANLSGSWHHVAATYNAATNTRTLYLDGVAISSDNPGPHAVPNANNLTIGTTNGNEYFNGRIDEVRVWSVARTAAQLSITKGTGLPGGTAGLLAYYRLNEGSGTTTADATGTAANLATFVNGPAWTTDAAPVTNGTPVTLTVTDTGGNTATAPAIVTVLDNTAPAVANLLPDAPALALANVPEAAGYGVLYQVDMPANANFGSLGAVAYAVDKSATVLPANPARVAYYVELTSGGTTRWVWASMDNFAANLTQLGLPHPTANPVNWHQSVSNLNVYSNAGGTLVTGSSLGTGRVEMWPSNYTQTNTDNVAVANGSYFDMSDGGQNTAAGHGSFQVHNLTTPQTVFGYNGWGSSAAADGVGIGNQNAPGTGDTDWTFGNNVGNYTVKSLYILVPDPSASIQSATVALGAGGTVTVSPAQVYRGNATDNCGTVTASISPNTFTCANLGDNPVTVTLSDGYGNTTSRTAIVTVSVPVTPTTTWLGTSTDWTSCANWSFGQVPDAATSVIIPTGKTTYPSLPAGTYPVLSLTIDAGGTLTEASGATLQVNGNCTNNGTATLNGTVAFVGSAATQTLSIASGVTTLTVNKAAGTVQLAQNLTINSGLTLSSGTLTTTASYQVNLGGSATISESDASYVIGKVVVNRPLAPGAAQSFSGLGLTLTPAAGSTAPGATVLTRTTGTALAGAGTSQSILRSFNIQPAVNTGLSVTMDFAYFPHELNGIAVASLRLFKSVSGGTPWIPQRGTTAVGSVITKTGITDFSIWTLGNNAAPLPVELAAFTATAEGPAAVRLAWATASEKNSQAFEVERSADGIAFDHIGTVAAAGSSSCTRRYELLDAKLPAGAARLYYRLRQVDLDGTFAYSPVRTVPLTGAAAGLALYPNPAHAGAATFTGAQPGTVVTVFDAQGRLVTTAPADATGTAALMLPAGLPTGVYVVRVGASVLRLTVE
ncbi:LamG-like jellyroll fold domain-containing protein [Hymenobacter artigasi]|uniref:receptor protein-tyrosine kinase n=1 Tax=Hymenobacter artigasi TaxID=2719616 RepID=A0ABX1HKU4_9BACT|nr:LamG-like jellyroll fold domain-containing protein [Hymenobacter artigasi]NKI90886.1 hypothetical protein [Hymenobacter artigasi]